MTDRITFQQWINAYGSIDGVEHFPLRELRKAMGLSLQQMAERMDISLSTLSKIEQGTIELSETYLVKLARALNVSVLELTAALYKRVSK